MTEDQRVKIKAKIELKLKELAGQIADLEELTKPISPDNAIGRVSRMDAINNKSVAEAGLRSAKSKFNKLERALTRVDLPEFGQCSRCQQPIRVERLLFMPESTRCVNCARKY